MTFYIVPIVEGQSEAVCIERLLHRIWMELLAAPIRLQVLQASRGKRNALLNTKHPELGAKVQEAYAKLARKLRSDTTGTGLLLLLLDAESDCPAKLAPKLLKSGKKVRGDADICCVIANRMFENWIVAGASTLAGVNGLPDPLPPRNRFEERSGAAWLSEQLRSRDRTRSYKKTTDALHFTRAMNLAECRANSPSFDKLCRELDRFSSSSAAPSQSSPTNPAASPSE